MDTHTSIIQGVLNRQVRFGLLSGDSKDILRLLPDHCIDCVITSPPYWKQRDYNIPDSWLDKVIGEEPTPQAYTGKLVAVFQEIRRILKPAGSLWLNIGDKYDGKNLMGMPWRVALALQDDGWILRNDVIWEKVKGTQPVKDRLRNNHEHFFHFVKQSRYYYDVDSILIKPRLQPTVSDTATISATGVSGKKYRQQIQHSEQLTESEKQAALKALEETLEQIRQGEVVDFRMTIRGQQRVLHGNQGRMSGRARELEQNGFFVMKSYTKGFVPSDVWRIVPEDAVHQRHKDHYAVFPVELLKIPVNATCPADGIILDPFVGVGSTMVAALAYGRRCLGIDINEEFVEAAQRRLRMDEGVSLRYCPERE